MKQTMTPSLALLHSLVIDYTLQTLRTTCIIQLTRMFMFHAHTRAYISRIPTNNVIHSSKSLFAPHLMFTAV